LYGVFFLIGRFVGVFQIILDADVPGEVGAAGTSIRDAKAF
jgi:hypothetical protein